jgi:hypothetical protein
MSEGMMRTPSAGWELTFGENTPETEARLQELMLYIVEKCGSDQRFGATKLNKILFWSDFYAYAQNGRPLTGVEYMREKHGPVPKRLVPIRDELVNRGDLDVTERQLFNGQTQTRFFARRAADMSLFSSGELELVNQVIDYLRDQTAKEVSDATHGRAWKSVPNGTLLPYEMIFVSDRGVLAADLKAIRELGERYNWRDRIMRRRGTLHEPALDEPVIR